MDAGAIDRAFKSRIVNKDRLLALHEIEDFPPKPPSFVAVPLIKPAAKLLNRLPVSTRFG
jgi:hypothetical protein